MAETAIQKVDPLALRAKSAMARQADEFMASSVNYYQGDIEDLVRPLGMDYARFKAQVLLTIYTNPGLLECDGKSFTQAVIRSAECGLSLSPTLGLAYIVPFKEKGTPKAQLIVGYKGLVYSAVRAGMALALRAQVIRAKDPFEYEEGAFEVLRHRPDARLTEEQRGDVIAAYAVATLGPELRSWTLMPRSELDRIEASSKAASNPSGPWKLHKPEMQKKTAARRLCKWLQAAPDVPAHKAAALERTLETVDAEWTHSDNAIPVTTAPTLPGETATKAEVIEPSRAHEVVGLQGPPLTDEHAPVLEQDTDPLSLEMAAISRDTAALTDPGVLADVLIRRIAALPKGEERDRLHRALQAKRASLRGA